jgi:hypothetical protein
MKINVIKELVEKYSIDTIEAMTAQLENGEPLSHPVGGDDEGEQLTHLLGAGWILKQIREKGTDMKTELRNFAARVRDSIS